MKNKLSVLLMVFFFFALTNMSAQDGNFLSKEAAKTALEQSIQTFDNVDMEKASQAVKIELGIMNKLKDIISQEGMSPQQAMEMLFPKLREKGWLSSTEVDAIENKVLGILTK